MPQDVETAVSPLERVEGSFQVPGFELQRRWFPAHDLTAELSDEVFELLRVAFNGDPAGAGLPLGPRMHFDWKFRDYPLGSTAALTTEPNGRVIGFRGTIRRVWQIRGRAYVAATGYDSAQHPDWQGRGLGRVLNDMEHLEWHPSLDLNIDEWTHPAHRHMAQAMERVFPLGNETRDYVRLVRPFGVIGDWLAARRSRAQRCHTSSSGQAAPRSVSNTARMISSRDRSIPRLRLAATRAWRAGVSLLTRRPGFGSPPWTISTVSRFEDEHEPLITSAIAQFDMVAERPIAYLNWRFADERAGPFTIRIATQEGQQLGYAVTRVHHRNAFVADVLALPGRSDVAESLIRDSISLAEDGAAQSLRIRLPHRHPYRRALARTGFFDLGHIAGELIDCTRANISEFAFLRDESVNVHYVFGDTDWI